MTVLSQGLKLIYSMLTVLRDVTIFVLLIEMIFGKEEKNKYPSKELLCVKSLNVSSIY